MNTAWPSLTSPESEVESLYSMVKAAAYPCLGAKSALANDRIACVLAGDLCSGDQDEVVVQFLYDFIDRFRKDRSALSSAVVIYQRTAPVSEDDFDLYLWRRLQALADIDATVCAYDTRVSGDPESADFSFSLKAEGLYVIGLHPASSRKARQFLYPAIVFNPHQQFDLLRSRGKYDTMKGAIRKRDVGYSGSINPMLTDFGVNSEAIQYSGKEYGNNWKCPFISRHQHSDDDSTAEWGIPSAEQGRSAADHRPAR